MISEIRKDVQELLGKRIKVIVDIGRNKSEVYEGVVVSCYRYVWTLKTSYDLKCFSYIDLLIKTVIISS